MINNRQNGRRRGRGGNGGGGGGQRSGNPGRPDNGNRIDNRARGNANQLYEKYKNLASDAQRQGDRVNTEYYLQFADHYFRVLNESRSRFDDQHQRRQQAESFDDFDDGDEFADEGEPIRAGDQMGDYRQEREDRNARDRDDRAGRDDRNSREDRAGREERAGRDDRNGRDRDDRGQRQSEPRREAGSRDGYAGDTVANDADRSGEQDARSASDGGEVAAAADDQAPRGRRGRRPRNLADEAGAEAVPVAALEADRLPPALGDVGEAGEDSGEAPKVRRRRGRPAAAATSDEAPQAAE